MSDLSKQKGQKFVKCIANFYKPVWLQILALIAFTILFKFAFTTWTMSFAFLISMIAHELGHQLVFSAKDIETRLIVIFPLGAAVMPTSDEEEAKSNKLALYALSGLLLAGPFVTVLLAMIGRLLVEDSIMPWVTRFGGNLLYINTILAIFNLMPIWEIDAGQILKLIVHSIESEIEDWVAMVFIALSFAIVLLLIFYLPEINNIWGIQINIFNRAVPILFIMVLISSIVLRRNGRDPELIAPGQAMDTKQIINVLIAYFLLHLLIILSNWPR